MKATVLLFNFNEKERSGMITRALLPLGLRIKKVKREDYLQPMGYLVGKKDCKSIEQRYDGEEIEYEMLFMAGMTNSQIDQLLLAMRKAGVGKIACKAVLTEANQHWNALELFEELKKEHKSFSSSSDRSIPVQSEL